MVDGQEAAGGRVVDPSAHPLETVDGGSAGRVDRDRRTECGATPIELSGSNCGHLDRAASSSFQIEGRALPVLIENEPSCFG